MINNGFSQWPVFFYGLRFIIVYAVFYIQTFFINPILASKCAIDFVSLIVFMVFLERNDVFSFFFLLWVALLQQSASAAPSGFFLFYYLFSFIFINGLYKFFLLENTFEKGLAVFVVLCFNYLILYIDISAKYTHNLAWIFFKENALGCVLTWGIFFVFLVFYQKFHYLFKRTTWS